MTERYLTILVVPHDERNVRRLRLSYRRLALVAGSVALILVAAVLGALTWGRVAARAAQAEMLERENRRLAAENARVEEIAANLEHSEQVYRQIRAMAGLPPDEDAEEVALAPVGTEPDARPVERPAELGGRPGPTPSGWPLTLKGFVTAEYTGRDGHTGVDIAVPVNTPVAATADGTVKQTGTDPVYGVFVVLAHADGYETMYAHNAHLLVDRDERVTRGQIIAYSGNSGQSSAPHLHYEVRRGGWPVDPTPFLR